MANRDFWQEEYWLPLMQLYLKKPQGVKPAFSRPLVSLALELHIEPKHLHQRMLSLRKLDTPSLRRLWTTYADNPRRLSREIRRHKKMDGFGHADEFYNGVEMQLSWERDFQPVDQWSQLTAAEQRGSKPVTPVMLILVLNLYFCLTPNTMVVETPEVVQLGKTIGLTPRLIVNIMEMFRLSDPYLSNGDIQEGPLFEPCKAIWARYGNDNQEDLSALAAQLKDYF
jgi:hypothetical protein